ncbi:sensor domain-containing diguanylate cyclase (plasmid) [Shewanella sp. SNU WT4]|uniref:sensor domain-containing diguanylate cyclase n=1 Tax=Shewanella sp. SNU WT4 TaxID=2590015 RepID=UPI0011294D88|nr:sensor domain-containing diguanylate cyclase [Shewanella sp. SNU WT4]QDF68681.1 sensor domain-containing diguanylate cyclase [Shewanella sp. SNU WT4]
MKSSKKPINEKIRLKQLHDLSILDTPPEERFDCVTRMAKRLFDVPIALVSFVDENRQWFKSKLGLDVNETERRISFCSHAILKEDTFIVKDTMKDDRFINNPLVVGEPYIRFYAGQPLRTLSGQILGTVCIIDIVPRDFNSEDIAMLVNLADMIEREMMSIQLTMSDELTKISNRRGFFMLTRHCLGIFSRESLSATIIFFDLDKFKEINDKYGHAEGDRALKIFADEMKKSFRTSDVCARFGGDEFVALLINANIEQIKALIKRLTSSLKLRSHLDCLPYCIEFSSGVVNYEPLKHKSIEDMLKEADKLMYHDKIYKNNNLLSSRK